MLTRSCGSGYDGEPPLVDVRSLKRSAGQLTVELLLILPVFLLIVFIIMELGHLAFWTIVVNHVAYECARVGSMYAGADQPKQAPRFDSSRASSKIQEQLRKVLPSAALRVTVGPDTFTDPQDGQQSRDIVVTVTQKVHLIFPMTPWVLRLSRNCRGGTGTCTVSATVPMPIENPQRYSAL